MRHAILVCALACTACTVTRTARLYDLDVAQDIMKVTYKAGMSGRGPIWIGNTQANADCSGEYSTIASGSAGWGAIYSGTTVSTALVASSETAQRGRAIVTCHDGRVIECEYVTSADTGAGNGACTDNRAHRYRLMF